MFLRASRFRREILAEERSTLYLEAIMLLLTYSGTMRNMILMIFALAMLAGLPPRQGQAELLPGWRKVESSDGGRLEFQGLDRTPRFVYAVAELAKKVPQYFFLKHGVALPVSCDDGSSFAPDPECRAIVNGSIVAPSWYARTSTANLPTGRVFVLEADKATPLTINGKPLEIDDWWIEDSFGTNCACFSLVGVKEQRKRLMRVDGTKAVELPLPTGVNYFRLDSRTREIVITSGERIWRYEKDQPVEILHEDGDTLTLPRNGVVRLFNEYLVIPTHQASILYRLVNGRAVPIEPPDGARFISVFPLGATTFAMTEEEERGPSTLYTLTDGVLHEFASTHALNSRFGPPKDLGGFGIICGEAGPNQHTLFRISEKALRPLRYRAVPPSEDFLDVAGARGVALVVVGRGLLGVVRSSGHVELARTTSAAPIKARTIDLAACAEGFYALCTGTKDGDMRTVLYYRREP